MEPAFLKKVLEKTTSALMAAGKGASKKLVDATKPLPTVGHLEMFFIGATTLVTVAVNLNAGPKPAGPKPAAQPARVSQHAADGPTRGSCRLLHVTSTSSNTNTAHWDP